MLFYLTPKAGCLFSKSPVTNYHLLTYGKKTIVPITATPMAATSTAAAATSFIFPATGCFSLYTLSTSHSIQLLTNSNAMTNEMHKIRMHHSIRVTLKYSPAATTMMAANRWIQRFTWVANAHLKPVNAYLKLRSLFLKNDIR